MTKRLVLDPLPPLIKKILLDMAVERDVIFTVPSRGHEVRARQVLAMGSLELAWWGLSNWHQIPFRLHRQNK